MAGEKTVLITGCSSGIGHELARQLNEKGWHVIATARTAEAITDLSTLGVTTLSLDVDKPESVAALKDEVQSITGGKLDMLINNAGRNLTVPAIDLDIDEVESCFRTNLFGVMRMCKAFAPFVIATKGTIVQIGSVAAIMPYVFGSAYNASKAAVHAYSNTLRVELAPFGVKVITVVTGGVKSNIARTDRVLAPESLYLPINEEYVRRTKHSQAVGMDTDKYARSVVSKILRSRKPNFVWEGFGTNLVWFASNFLPTWVMDFYFSQLVNLRKLSKLSVSKKAV